MNNVIYHRRRWAAIPLDLLLNPTVSLEAKVLAAIIFSLNEGTNNLLDFTDPLGMSEDVVFTALSELETFDIVAVDECDGHYDIKVL